MLKMVKEDDPEAYLESFECLAIAAGWDMSWQATQLWPLLMGCAKLPTMNFNAQRPWTTKQLKTPSCTS